MVSREDHPVVHLGQGQGVDTGQGQLRGTEGEETTHAETEELIGKNWKKLQGEIV